MTTTKARSANMRAIKSVRNRSTELRLRSMFIRLGLRGWSVHPPRILGNPDFVFHQVRVAIFVDGCFWHVCPNCGHIPKANRTYWVAKLHRNLQRDKSTNRSLKRAGYTVIRMWECRLRRDPQLCIRRVQRALENRLSVGGNRFPRPVKRST
ncbi:MAG: very short patch repair endonuclease [Acidobacteriia bacterium]|nr:very short patch repair endonuclease [Terriglobia bacterium]